MTTQTQNIVGGRELDDLLRTLPAKMHKNINRTALRAGAVVMLREVKARIPKDTGQLEASARITSRAKGDQVSASAKVGNFVAWYAHLVEFGTRPHTIHAKPGSALRFGSVAVQAVRHPGIVGHPFMRPAAQAGFDEAVRTVEKKIRERLTKQGLLTPPPTPPDPEE